MAKKRGTPGLLEQLRELLNGSDEKMTELARKTKVDPANLSRFMRGKSSLSSAALDRIVRALHIRLVAGPADVPEGPPRGRRKGGPPK